MSDGATTAALNVLKREGELAELEAFLLAMPKVDRIALAVKLLDWQELPKAAPGESWRVTGRYGLGGGFGAQRLTIEMVAWRTLTVTSS